VPAADPVGRAERSPPRPQPALGVGRNGDSPLGLPAPCSKRVASGSAFTPSWGRSPSSSVCAGPPDPVPPTVAPDLVKE
jgi:hypothetical protein